MRILHLGNIAGVARVLAEGQRALGHEAQVFAFQTDANRSEADGIVAGSGPIGWNLAMVRLPLDWASLAAIHIHGGVWRSQMAYRLLRRRTRRAVWIVHLHGSETRTGKGLHYGHMVDGIVCSTPDLRAFVPEALWLPNPVPIPDAPPPRARGPRVVFGHFPTNRQIKGTEAILRAFQDAFGAPDAVNRDSNHIERRRWPTAELILGEGLPHATVLELMAGCDAVVDHLSDLGPVSLVALEAMALGRAALSSYDRAAYPTDCPVLPLHPADAAATLRSVTDDPSALERTAQAGRAYVEAHHRPEAVARRTIELYEEARRRRTGLEA